MSARHKSGFTLIELLVVVSIIALLIGILLPAINKARDASLQTRSAANLRQLATAHATYSSEWNDNQWTNNPHNLAAHGNTYQSALTNYIASIGGPASPMVNAGTGQLQTFLGWGVDHATGQIGLWRYPWNVYQMPIHLDNSLGNNFEGFGWFRMMNVQSFNKYLGGRVYDQTFYAPKDDVALSAIGTCRDDPHEYCIGHGNTGHVYWSSYVLSPAALFAPAMWTEPQDQFVQNMNEIFARYPGAFRTPKYSQARYPDLKTHMIEHHWLQNRRAACNESIPTTFGSYNGCTPYYFNHGMDSVPLAAFYDGHIASLGVREVLEADTRLKRQVHGNTPTFEQNGLWRRDTPMGVFGYFEELAWGYSTHAGYATDTIPRTSFHILTNDGILGRDTMPRGR